MLKQRSKPASKVTAILLALMMAVVFMPTFAFAADGDGGGTAAEPITVYLTVSDQGVIAKANDDSPMAWQEVTVEDLDKSGDFTFDEALKAAHKIYNTEDGYVASSGWVTSLWGVANNPASYSFLQNGTTTDMVTVAKVQKGDFLTASINQDAALYGDWATSFDKTSATTEKGKTVDLTLYEYVAMTKDEPAVGKNVQIGEWIDGKFVPIEGKTTDSSGKVSLSFDKPGRHIVTAMGAGENVNNSTMMMASTKDKDGKDVYGWIDYNSQDYDTYIGYTKEDYGEGAYPWKDIQWLNLDDFDAATFNAGHLLYSGKISNGPTIAPCCIVDVAADPVNVYLTVSDQGDIPADKNGTVMAWREVKATDADKDGKITYNEALIAAHDTYYEGGATAGYAVDNSYGYEMVTKLWGKDTTNTLFFVNGDGIPSGVTVDTVKDGDELVASINKDSVYYSDWYTEFDDYAKETNTNKQITLTLKGHLGMAYTPEEKKNVALKDVEIGEWISKDQPFKPIEENGKAVKTDENGQVTLSFEESGTHIITAKGTVKSKVADYSDYPNIKYIDNDCPTIAPACIVIVWKSDNPLAVKAVAKTVKAKKLKKKAQKVSGAVKITKQGAGTITYKGVGTNAKSKKALKINKNTGKITVKKNTKKGLYKMRVTVTASGDKSYMPGSKTVTVKIRVK